jgi:ABC-type bacteriocin/lantibiotic exporter with double-glycine peptidase domain
MLASLKAVKMLFAESRVSKTISQLRVAEMVAAWPFRSLQIVSTFLCRSAHLINGLTFRTLTSHSLLSLAYGALTLSSPLVFAVYIGVSRSEESFDATKIFTSLTLISLLANPLIHVFQALPTFGAAHGCFKRIQKFLEAEERVDPRKNITEFLHLGSEREVQRKGFTAASPERGSLILSLRNVSFGWSRSTMTLSNVSLNVRAATRIAILGRIGCGKTLLLKGLLGEVEQLGGDVKVAQSTSFAYCSQTPWLENVSAQQNFTQYGPDAEDSYLYRRLAQECDLNDLIRLPDYSSGTVGSGGIKLSGGQRQRLVRKSPLGFGR